MNRPSSGLIDGHLTPLEVGMYVLIAVLCAAMAVFISSCFVYASKFRSQKYPVMHTMTSLKADEQGCNTSQQQQRPLAATSSVQNAHDWIWLGKSTLDSKATESAGPHSEASNRSHQRLSLNQTFSEYIFLLPI